ncbi:MAG: hypothetical protein ACRD4G_07495 [Bryobacteraceae bacterium]
MDSGQARGLANATAAHRPDAPLVATAIQVPLLLHRALTLGFCDYLLHASMKPESF